MALCPFTSISPLFFRLNVFLGYSSDIFISRSDFAVSINSISWEGSLSIQLLKSSYRAEGDKGLADKQARY